MIKAYLKKDFSNNCVCQPLSLIKFLLCKGNYPRANCPAAHAKQFITNVYFTINPRPLQQKKQKSKNAPPQKMQTKRFFEVN